MLLRLESRLVCDPSSCHRGWKFRAADRLLACSSRHVDGWLAKPPLQACKCEERAQVIALEVLTKAHRKPGSVKDHIVKRSCDAIF